MIAVSSSSTPDQDPGLQFDQPIPTALTQQVPQWEKDWRECYKKCNGNIKCMAKCDDLVPDAVRYPGGQPTPGDLAQTALDVPLSDPYTSTPRRVFY